MAHSLISNNSYNIYQKTGLVNVLLLHSTVSSGSKSYQAPLLLLIFDWGGGGSTAQESLRSNSMLYRIG